MNKELLTIRDCAEYLSVGYRQVWEYINTNELKAHRIGKKEKSPWRVRRTDLEAFINRRSNEVTA